jgi:hypothetical protein
MRANVNRLRAVAGQNCWSSAGSYVAANGQDLVAADTGGRAPTERLAVVDVSW